MVKRGFKFVRGREERRTGGDREKIDRKLLSRSEEMLQFFLQSKIFKEEYKAPLKKPIFSGQRLSFNFYEAI